VHDPNSLQELSESPLPCGHSPSRPRLRYPLLCYTVLRVIHLSLPRFSRTGRTIHRVHDPNQYFTRTIKVSSSLQSLTLQAQAQASPSLLYSSSGDPSFLAKVFSHRNNSRDFIEPYSRGIPQTFSVEASLWLVLPQHNIF
jgi:hypothetical protein